MKVKRKKKWRLTLTSTRDGTRSTSSKKDVLAALLHCLRLAASTLTLLLLSLTGNPRSNEHGDALCLVDIFSASLGLQWMSEDFMLSLFYVKELSYTILKIPKNIHTYIYIYIYIYTHMHMYVCVD